MAEIFLCGDSHTAVLARYARKIGLAFRGGPIDDGIGLEDDFFSIGSDGLLELTGPSPYLRQRERNFRNLPKYDGPILSTVGFNSHRAAGSVASYLDRSDTRLDEISDAVFRALVLSMRSSSIKFYQMMVSAGRRIYFTTSPQLPVEPEQLPILQRFEGVLVKEVQKIGAKLIDIRPDIMRDGLVHDDFIKKDKKINVHGSDEWARLVFDRVKMIEKAGAHG